MVEIPKFRGSLRKASSLAILAAILGGGVLRRGRPPRRSLSQRLKAFPLRGLPLEHRLRIYWNDHQIPFVEAQSDRDLAVALGAVHAHLRLAQIEFMRRVAYGRLSEAVGPAALDLDHALRILDLGRAVPTIERDLPDDTRQWLDGFCDGINGYIRQMRQPPYELAVLGLAAQPWTRCDLLHLGRLAATDFTWRVWLHLFGLRTRRDWPQLWRRLVGGEAPAVPSFSGSAGTDLPDRLLSLFDRAGSNSLAVSPARSASGAALIASDPHLPVTLPNLWLIAGMKSPSFHTAGLMIPGIPAVALGRNPSLAWGGTSLHAASSDLFDLAEIDDGEIAERRVKIAVRWSRDREVTVRDSSVGPVISDALRRGPSTHLRLALRWVGHQPTDEVSAMLAMNRARSCAEFHRALDGFAIPAQNMICADAEGHIGQAMAARLPRRPTTPPHDVVAPPQALAHWHSMVTSRDLPSRLDPDSGFVASANNAPDSPEIAVGFFFSSNERVHRLRRLLSASSDLAIADLVRLQHDVTPPSARQLRDRLCEVLKVPAANGPEPPRDLLRALSDWDGSYTPNSAGALAFELTAYHLVAALHGTEALALYGGTWDAWALLHEDLTTVEAGRLAQAARAAATAAASSFRALGTWGAAHRLVLRHPFAALRFARSRFAVADMPVGGGNETVMKTAFGVSPGRHSVKLGANARHISDLADINANYFVLLGGQDGCPGSTTFADQVALWRRREMIRLPLELAVVRREFAHVTELAPSCGSAGGC